MLTSKSAIGSLLALCLCASVSIPGAQAQRSVNPAIVETQCRACHRDEFDSLAENPHSVLETEGWQARTGEPLVCRSCHGDVTEHIGSGGGRGNVFAFRAENPLAQSARCLECHAVAHPDFERSPHAQAGLACTNCHSNHAGGPHRVALLDAVAEASTIDRLGTKSTLCAGCHQEILAQFNLNERHRLLDGVLECTSCHNPHEPATRAMLGGFKRAMCTNCHTDKEGPFVFEHPASRTEGCTACHSPHGSPNRHLLSSNRVAEVCITCHAAIPQFHLGSDLAAPPRFNLDTQCTNCHSSIHGSNFHPRFLR
jgi:DmsE family decaheme c-type cytochrome